MKTGLLIVAILTTAWLSPGTVLVAAEAAPPALPATAEGLVAELIRSVEELTKILEGLKTEADITAAKGKLHDSLQLQTRISNALDKTATTPEEEAKIKTKFEAAMNTSLEKLNAQYQRLSEVAGFKETMKAIQVQVQKGQ